MVVCNPPSPVTGQTMASLIDKLIKENKKLSEHKKTNVLPRMMKKFSAVYGEAVAADSLKTFVERYDTTFNVYWQMIEEAAEYRVEVYKASGMWYKLAEIDVDRNRGYVALTDLVGDGYVFRVVAEDRSGNILARSAGMVIGCETTD